MVDRSKPIKDSARVSASALSATSQPAGSNVIRPRNRRHDDARQSDGTSVNVQSESGIGRLRPSTDVVSRSGDVSRSSEHAQTRFDQKSLAGGHELAQFLSDSWAQSWTSVQAFASNIIPKSNISSNGSKSPQGRANLRSQSRLVTWGPVPPSRPTVTNNTTGGSLAHRQAALKAVKTASVLESYEGVNGGLDISGKYKRRTSDELVPHDLEPVKQLVYVHEVQPDDTYAGIVLRYKCREDVFRKSNRLWSQDSVQTRKWLILPVDACEVKGRPLDSQSWHQGSEEAPSNDGGESAYNASSHCEQDSEDDKPWTHVRWVQIDSFTKPVQVARVARQALGYFPPRRKRSVRTTSSTTSPRQSLDLANLALSSNGRPSFYRDNPSNRQPPLWGTPISSRSRVDSETADTRPAWMRRPGGVGSMDISVKEPGPDKDYFNTWAKKHLPGLDVDTMPSMSVMGSDSAHFGFRQAPATIVENPFDEGRDTGNMSHQGSGLDRAAAAVEHWLRGALAKRPSTPLLGDRSRGTGLPSDQDVTDLIELTDATSEQDRRTNLLTPSRTTAVGRTDDSVPLRDKTGIDGENADTHKKHD